MQDSLINQNLLTEDFDNFLGIKLNLGKVFESASSGGKKWNKNEASRFSKKVAGKVDSARSDLNAIIGQDASKVKEKRTDDFKKMVSDAKSKQILLEQKWKDFQVAQSKGWDSQSNRDAGKVAYDRILSISNAANAAWKLKHDWITESLIDKAAQAYKTVNFAAIRGLFLLFLQFNVFNSASYFKLASLRTPDKFKKTRLHFKELGGKRTTFDKAMDKGYKKNPLFGKKMKVNWDKKSSVNGDDAEKDSAGMSLTISNSILGLIPAAGTVAGAAIMAGGTPLASAGGGAAGGIVGGILAKLLSEVSGMGVPLDEGETQGEIDTNGTIDANTIKQMADAKAEADKEAEKSEFPTWGYIVIGGIVLVGLSIGAYFLLRKKKAV